ncbi:MAG: hypothetical protein WBC06_17590 [Chitinophagaceae bacterium]
MFKYFKLYGYSLFIFITLNLMSSCKNGDGDKKATEDSVSATDSKSTEVKQEEAKAMAIAGTLDNLWIEISEFKKLDDKKRLIFSFAFRKKDALTLYGWSCSKKGSDSCTFSTNPDIKLKNGQASGISYGPEVFFGSIILHRKSIKYLQNNFNQYRNFVFVPENNAGFITYKIFVTNDDPSQLALILALDPTGEEANPSPPKDY